MTNACLFTAADAGTMATDEKDDGTAAVASSAEEEEEEDAPKALYVFPEALTEILGLTKENLYKVSNPAWHPWTHRWELLHCLRPSQKCPLLLLLLMPLF